MINSAGFDRQRCSACSAAFHRTTSRERTEPGRNIAISRGRRTPEDDGLTEAEAVSEVRHEIRVAMELAATVYNRRTEFGLTQAELADRAGLTQAKISRIEGSDAVATFRY
ncbi:helix-turn-helix domain-containing protein [Nocardia beijingensis]|uniref:Helix-turn-helix domain-containing protein n=1 Tax=Nocardia beijingensis TaxID=95162 RepID=A0ABW7WNG0_9NOCA